MYNNFAMIPNKAQELNPFDYALYGAYVRTCGWDDPDRECFKANQTLADETQMSISSVKKSRKSLQELGYITVQSQGRNRPAIVQLCHDVWDKNGNPSGSEKTSSGSEKTSSGSEKTSSGSEKTTQWFSENHNQYLNNNNHQSRIIYQDNHHQENPAPHPDDDLVKILDSKILELFEGQFGQPPNVKEQQILSKHPVSVWMPVFERLPKKISNIATYLDSCGDGESDNQTRNRQQIVEPTVYTTGEWADFIES